jgi:probable rRNA maturation factor
VLAFPIDEEPVEGGRSPDSGGTGPGYIPPEAADMPRLLGDVVVCPAVAFRNAPEHAGTYEDEVALLIVHGILHLMGMDHQDDAEAEAMEAKERELLARHHAPPLP